MCVWMSSSLIGEGEFAAFDLAADVVEGGDDLLGLGRR